MSKKTGKHGIEVYIDLAEHVGYDPDSGQCFWRFDRRRGKGRGYIFRRAGDPAGSFDRRTGYTSLRVGTSGPWVAMHRFAWFSVHGYVPDDEVDHINGDRGDNRIDNLRLATKSENQRNAKTRKDSRTGFKGVRQEGNKFMARCRVNGKREYLGLYDTAEEAHAAYCAAAERYHGDFARFG